MYNKLFTKVLDSSVWLESSDTRVVWMTLLASMDEDGMCQFATVANLARRAIVPLDACHDAVARLEAPDPDSSDPENDGRRIERVPGGWVVLNAGKYRAQVTREESKRLQRERSQRYRDKKKQSQQAHDEDIATRDASVTTPEIVTLRPSPSRTRNECITQSEAEAYTEAKTKGSTLSLTEVRGESDVAINETVSRLFEFYRERLGRDPLRYSLTPERRKKAYLRLKERMKIRGSLAAAEIEAGQCIENLAASDNHQTNGYIDWIDHIFKSAEVFEKRLNWKPMTGGNGNGNSNGRATPDDKAERNRATAERMLAAHTRRQNAEKADPRGGSDQRTDTARELARSGSAAGQRSAGSPGDHGRDDPRTVHPGTEPPLGEQQLFPGTGGVAATGWDF